MAVTENSCAHCPNHVLGGRIAGQNDSCIRLHGANAGGDPQTVRAITPLARQYDVERKRSQALFSVGFAKSVMYRTVLVFQDAAKQFVGGTVGVDNQQAAGTQSISVH